MSLLRGRPLFQAIASALVATLGVLAAPAIAQAPMWKREGAVARPSAGVKSGGAAILIACHPKPAPVYILLARGPANGLKSGRGVSGRVEGRRNIKVRFDSAEVAWGIATLKVQGGTRGTIGDQPRALYAVDAIRDARKPIVISSGAFRVMLPATGVKPAMEPLIKACGDPAKLAKRAEGR